jgi:hypothetical protein
MLCTDYQSWITGPELLLTIIEQESWERSLSAMFRVETVQSGLQQRLFPLFTSYVEELDIAGLSELTRSHDDEFSRLAEGQSKKECEAGKVR